jgi:hypothetical protein
VLGDRIAFPTSTAIKVYDKKGRPQRTVDLDVALRGGAVGQGTRIYVGSDHQNGGRLLAVNLARNYDMVDWELMTFGGISSAPAMLQDVIYVGSEDGKVYAVNKDRTPVWPTPGGVFRHRRARSPRTSRPTTSGCTSPPATASSTACTAPPERCAGSTSPAAR